MSEEQKLVRILAEEHTRQGCCLLTRIRWRLVRLPSSYPPDFSQAWCIARGDTASWAQVELSSQVSLKVCQWLSCPLVLRVGGGQREQERCSGGKCRPRCWDELFSFDSSVAVGERPACGAD